MGCFLLIPGSFLLPPANEVWGKVKCLHLSVILSTGGGGGWCLVPGVSGPDGVCLVQGGRCLVPGGLVPGGGCLVWGSLVGGVCAWSRGSGPGGYAWWGVPGRGGAWWRPPRTATAAGGTHPTGMHSCFTEQLVWNDKVLQSGPDYHFMDRNQLYDEGVRKMTHMIKKIKELNLKDPADLYYYRSWVNL